MLVEKAAIWAKVHAAFNEGRPEEKKLPLQRLQNALKHMKAAKNKKSDLDIQEKSRQVGVAYCVPCKQLRDDSSEIK